MRRRKDHSAWGFLNFAQGGRAQNNSSGGKLYMGLILVRSRVTHNASRSFRYLFFLTYMHNKCILFSVDKLRTANLLGAAALAISDRLIDAVAEMVACGSSAPAALITLVSEPGVGVTGLGARIGLSQPAAARLVSNLAANGLVERRAGQDDRSQALFPTDVGREKAHQALKVRQQVTSKLIDELDPSEQQALTNALEKMLAALLNESHRPYVLCRVCDRAMCIADGHICPVSAAARAQGL